MIWRCCERNVYGLKHWISSQPDLEASQYNTTTVNGRKRGSKKVNFRMATILRVLLLCTFFVSSCLSAPKFQLIETEDDGEEGAPDEVDPPQKEVDPDEVDPDDVDADGVDPDGVDPDEVDPDEGVEMDPPEDEADPDGVDQDEVDPDEVDPPEDEVDPPPVGSSQEESLEDGEGADYQ